jgi:hypothetical protein
MRAHIEAAAQACETHPYRLLEVDEIEMPEEQLERLRALGYAD